VKPRRCIAQERTLKQKDMKVFKKPALPTVQIAHDRDRNNTMTSHASAIKLKAVTDAERQRLRISSYQYILP